MSFRKIPQIELKESLLSQDISDTNADKGMESVFNFSTLHDNYGFDIQQQQHDREHAKELATLEILEPEQQYFLYDEQIDTATKNLATTPSGQDISSSAFSIDYQKPSEFSTQIDTKTFRIINVQSGLREYNSLHCTYIKAQKFCSNVISTTKYNILTFIPKNLFEQFQRVANIYFLVVSILTLIPNISPIGSLMIFTLIFIIAITALRALIEDIRRYFADLKNNNMACWIWNEERACFEQKKWKHIKTGDIIKVYNKQFFPADLVLLGSSDEQGISYVETSNLDGESNLKIKRCKMETQSKCSPETQLIQLRAIINCERPSNRLYNFEGNLFLLPSTDASLTSTLPPQQETIISLSVDQLLLRGSSLQNTKFIIGAAVYTGKDTRLMRNRTKTRNKVSQVEKLANKFVFFLFCFLIALSAICALGYMLFTTTAADLWVKPSLNGLGPYWYLFGPNPGVTRDKVFGDGLLTFLSFFILFNTLIPISLYVTLEFTKLLQGLLIEADLKMYDHATETKAGVKNCALNEELGQVEFIFSDKTGTLTANVMEFFKFSVGSQCYGQGQTDIAIANWRRNHSFNKNDPNAPKKEHDRFFDTRICHGKWLEQSNCDAIKEFLVLLAVCHTALPEFETNNPQESKYLCSSPDELALLEGAKDLGVIFYKKYGNNMTVRVMDHDETFEILNVCEFNSDRKRMSVIVKDSKGVITLYCKGADSIIAGLLHEEKRYWKETAAFVEQFAEEGLRTLVCAKRVISEQEYEQWSTNYRNAQNSLKNRSQQIDLVAAQIEVNLEIVGTTAIEDKLQENVPETIESLLRANIKIWVLTGDRLETALNIGYACNLVSSGTGIIRVEGDTITLIQQNLQHNLMTMSSATLFAKELGLLVEGHILHTILENKELTNLFLQVSVACKSVICCRVTPKQKADVVSLVKKNLNIVTLAIGDGANDVSMIQSAHIGIGINGKEGLQAANSADYTIAQFQFLKRLLLVHGRWNYRRISKLILYNFYKNLVLYLTQFWFVFFSGFSGQTIQERWTLSNYNIWYTAYPVMILGLFDKDVEAEQAERFPQLYIQGQNYKFFNVRVFFQWVLNGIYHSLICFFLPLLVFQDMSLVNGQSPDILIAGSIMFTSIFWVVTGKMFLETTTFTWVSAIGFSLSIIFWLMHMPVFGSAFYVFNWFQGVNWEQFPFNAFWIVLREFYPSMDHWRTYWAPSYLFLVALTVVVALLKDYVWHFFKRLTFKKLYYDIQAMQRDEDIILLSQQQQEAEGLVAQDPLLKLPANLRRVFQLNQGLNETQVVKANRTKFLAQLTGVTKFSGFVFTQAVDIRQAFQNLKMNRLNRPIPKISD